MRSRWFLLLPLLLAACSKPTTDQAAAPPPGLPTAADAAQEPPPAGAAQDAKSTAQGLEPGRKYVIGMSQCNRGEPWRVQMDKDLDTAAKEHAAQLEVVFNDAQNDVTKQQAQVREFISRGIDLLVISPKEAKPLAQPVAEAMAKGIPVIVLDRDIDGGNYTCFIGADNVKIGRAAGEHLKKILAGKGKIVELQGLQTSVPGQDRHNGFMEGIKGSQIEVVFDADCKWLEPNARKEMQSALTRFPEIDAVYGHNDPSAHGAYLAAQAAKREKAIKFIGIDGLPHEGVKYVQDGLLDATFLYPTGGAEAIATALKILAGETVEKRITLGTKVFTKENVAQGGEVL
ncbi:MAG: substrate-binding domain-containing protein [Fimbriimonadaceae bacterium]|nr:substrate-binding domain-containing protein [Fimbriimonadaceae bacterium]